MLALSHRLRHSALHLQDNTVRHEKHLGYLLLSRYLSKGIFNGTKQSANTAEDREGRHADKKENELEQIDKDTTLVHSDGDDQNFWKWKLQDTWLAKAIEPALHMFKGVTTDGDSRHKVPSSSRSLSEVFSDLQRSKIGLQDWSLGDLTVGLYLVYLRQASVQEPNDVKGTLMYSDILIEDLIYHVELAKGAYKGSSAGLARHSMLQEKNVLKFVKDSNVMRPGYYIATDVRNKLVVFGIRGTHTVYDIITDIISSSDKKDFLFEGFSTHFGTAVAARWFLHHEIRTIKQCMDKKKGFRLRLVGHSLGGAAASLLAIMLRKKSIEELGFDPCLVSAVGIGTPPCLSKDLAQNCSDFVTTVVMQDDIVPRLSISSLTRLRNEIVHTDWTSILEKEDWGTVLDWISNAKQAVSSIQDVAQRLSHVANLKKIPGFPDFSARKEVEVSPGPSKKANKSNESLEVAVREPEPDELFVPGTVYFLKKQADASHGSAEAYSLWRMQAGEQIPRILLSGSLISDHRCDSHYYALREVLKELPRSDDRSSM